MIAGIRVLLIKHGYATASDISIIELHVRDVFTRHTPLVGPYSRFGWNHPGPALYYVLAIPYWLSGRSSSGLALGALAVNAGRVRGCGPRRVPPRRRSARGRSRAGDARVPARVRPRGRGEQLEPHLAGDVIGALLHAGVVGRGRRHRVARVHGPGRILRGAVAHRLGLRCGRRGTVRGNRGRVAAPARSGPREPASGDRHDHRHCDHVVRTSARRGCCIRAATSARCSITSRNRIRTSASAKRGTSSAANSVRARSGCAAIPTTSSPASRLPCSTRGSR